MRTLVVFGYAGVATLLLVALALELFGDLMPETRFVSVVGNLAGIPIPAVVVSSCAYVAGWTLILTGASDCRRRIFLPVMGLFLIQLILGLAFVYGDSGAAFLLLATPALLLVVTPAVVHLFAPKLRFWKELPVVEALYWAGVTGGFVGSLWISSGSVPLAANQIYIVMSELLVLSTAFWFLLALDVVDLAVDVSRPAVAALRGGERRDGALRLVLAPALLLYPALLLFLLRVSEGPMLGVMFLCGFVLSLPISGATLALLVLRRWSADAAVTLLTLALASFLLAFGISLSLSGQDFTEFALSATGVIPPLTLFALLMVYDVLNFGLRFANKDGRVMPRTGRTLVYLGAATLVIGYALFFLNMKGPGTGQSSEELQVVVNGVFMLGVVFLGPPYLAWITWKRRDRLVGKPVKSKKPEQRGTQADVPVDKPSPKNAH